MENLSSCNVTIVSTPEVLCWNTDSIQIKTTSLPPVSRFISCKPRSIIS